MKGFLKSKKVYWLLLFIIFTVGAFIYFYQGDIKDAANSLSNNQDITETEGVKHSIPLEEIVEGGPGKDGIPSIDEPKFESISQASSWLEDDDVGLVVTIGDKSRFYPYRILVWHEIVNDTINGQRVLVTYCPLCFSGIVFEPVVDGQAVEFGVSGKLWENNLLMYDRKTDSLWSQVKAEAVVGPQTGNKLEILPSDISRFKAWREANPNGRVLARDTGFSRNYSRDPYGNYYTTGGALFPIGNQDDRLPQKTFVLGLVINGQAKAYSVETIKERGEIKDTFAGKSIVAKYNEASDTVRLFEKEPSGELTRLNPVTSFWFAWAAVYPDTEVLK